MLSKTNERLLALGYFALLCRSLLASSARSLSSQENDEDKRQRRALLAVTKKTWLECDCVCLEVDWTVCPNEPLIELADFMGVGDQVRQVVVTPPSTNQEETTSNASRRIFHDAIVKRLDIMRPSVDNITLFNALNPPRLTTGIAQLVALLHARNKSVYLFSHGLHSLIEPIAVKLGIEPTEHVFANKLRFRNDTLAYAGLDNSMAMSSWGGKARVIQQLKSRGGRQRCERVVVVGADSTDIKALPVADALIGFGGHVVRPRLRDAAGWFVRDFQLLIDELEERDDDEEIVDLSLGRLLITQTQTCYEQRLALIDLIEKQQLSLSSSATTAKLILDQLRDDIRQCGVDALNEVNTALLRLTRIVTESSPSSHKMRRKRNAAAANVSRMGLNLTIKAMQQSHANFKGLLHTVTALEQQLEHVLFSEAERARSHQIVDTLKSSLATHEAKLVMTIHDAILTLNQHTASAVADKENKTTTTTTTSVDVAELQRALRAKEARVDEQSRRIEQLMDTVHELKEQLHRMQLDSVRLEANRTQLMYEHRGEVSSLRAHVNRKEKELVRCTAECRSKDEALTKQARLMLTNEMRDEEMRRALVELERSVNGSLQHANTMQRWQMAEMYLIRTDQCIDEIKWEISQNAANLMSLSGAFRHVHGAVMRPNVSVVLV